MSAKLHRECRESINTGQNIINKRNIYTEQLASSEEAVGNNIHTSSRLSPRNNSLLLQSPRLDVIDENVDYMAGGDYTAYQSADLNNFFWETKIPQQVSEICLVNDHFILVKMPETAFHADESHKNSKEECIFKDENNEKEEILKNSKTESAFSTAGKKFTKYFVCHRARRIMPIQEVAPADTEKNIANIFCLPLQTNIERQKPKKREQIPSISTIPTTSNSNCFINKSWHSDGGVREEVFTSKTKIFTTQNAKFQAKKQKIARDLTDVSLIGQHNDRIHKRMTVIETEKKPLDLGIERLRVQEYGNSIFYDIPSYEKYEIEEKHLRTSLSETVSVKCFGAIATDEKSYNNLWKTFDLQPQRASFSALDWLLKPFRYQRNRTKKSETKINTIVYKTYFNRWKKPPDAIWNGGYGVRRLNANIENDRDYEYLRRCRSAVF